MMNDSVREELKTKITSGSLPRLNTEQAPRPALLNTEPPAPVERRPITARLATPKTSPTLVGFQTPNASLPDWRLQLQNAVQARKGQTATPERSFPTNGGAALKAEIIHPAPEPAAAVEENISDPRVASAMRRIDRSRQIFAEPAAKQPSAPTKPKQRAFPFDVVAGGNIPRPAPPMTRMPASLEAPQKPKLFVPKPSPPQPAAELKRDTNKLPPLPVPAKIEKVEPIEEPLAVRPIENVPSGQLPVEFAEIKRIRIKAEDAEIEPDFEPFEDEIEDLAPFSMRFGAGLFDLIVGGFISLIAIAPFALTGGDWFTGSGVLVAVGTWAMVMFLYMTVAVGLLGKTLGMRLFSLELVDAVENEYPTLHQAAISSSVFLLSLAFAGAGFITLFFNEEKRAVHDLLSGTILVREF